MKFPRTYNIEEIAELIDCDFVGDKDFEVLGMNEIHVVTAGDIVFVDHPKYYDKALQSEASVVLINKTVDCPTGKALLISDDPFRDFNKLTTYFRPFTSAKTSIADSAKIGKGTIIQPNAFIGNNVIIGENCIIHPNVTIYDHCVLGDHVTIHANTVLGAAGFYYKNRPEGYDQLKSGGRVVIKDHVDIGAACTIDRGVTGDTTIGEGTKIDNQVQVGHDTVIGKKCLIASQTGIAGCVVIEDEVTIWGQVGVISGITIGPKSVILAQSGVGKSLAGNQRYFGSPADEFRIKFKEAAAIKALPNVIKHIKVNPS
ncbi:UDP-3-O-(3-hydroxymyristoyl)glucosamine N-acyltransferase [Gangjinia marincola]|uniref:UDP-3-O-(3-hydroxymyristoyl)glucosamine N-acyltransferase n=1 Tax=Gangjinia marincola TaxID=578463 RepID=A0ABP3XRC5_9FLAO